MTTINIIHNKEFLFFLQMLRNEKNLFEKRKKNCWTFRCANIYLVRIFFFLLCYFLRDNSQIHSLSIHLAFFDIFLSNIYFSNIFFLFNIKMHSHYAISCFFTLLFLMFFSLQTLNCRFNGM